MSQPLPGTMPATNGVDRIAGCATDLLARELRQLVKEGAEGGNWSDERGTADGLMALDECLPATAYPDLRIAACRWLIRQRIEDVRRDRSAPARCSWQEEIWDTAVAVIALARQARRFPEHASDFRGALAGSKEMLHGTFQRAHSNWNDEPWETTWALLAWERVRDIVATSAEPDIAAALEWLLGFVDSPRTGLLINAHYTALFLIVVQAYAANSVLGDGHELLVEQLKQARDRCAHGLNRILEYASPQTLWTNEIWSNSLVLWALTECDMLVATPSTLDRILTWFTRSLTGEQTVPPTEDRAFACIALFRLKLFLDQREHTTFLRTELGLAADLRATLEAAAKLLKREDAEPKLQAALAAKLGGVRDYRPNVRMFGSREHDGYYTINVSRKWTRATGMLSLTALGTALPTLSRGVLSNYVGFAALVVGVFATLATIFGFSLPDLLKRVPRGTDDQEP